MRELGLWSSECRPGGLVGGAAIVPFRSWGNHQPTGTYRIDSGAPAVSSPYRFGGAFRSLTCPARHVTRLNVDECSRGAESMLHGQSRCETAEGTSSIICRSMY